MTRNALLAVFLLPLLMMTAGCGDGDGADGDQATRSGIPEQSATPATPPETTGRTAIPPEMPDAVEGLTIAPYFDEEGTQTELAVAVGEVFSVYICIEHPGYEMKTAQWRMTVPAGITVLGETKAFDQALSMGSYKEAFVITYPCQNGKSTVNLLRYSCIASEDFTGGTFATAKAASLDGHNSEPPFLGFVTCGVQPEPVPAHGGSATLTLK